MSLSLWSYFKSTLFRWLHFTFCKVERNSQIHSAGENSAVSPIGGKAPIYATHRFGARPKKSPNPIHVHRLGVNWQQVPHSCDYRCEPQQLMSLCPQNLDRNVQPTRWARWCCSAGKRGVESTWLRSARNPPTRSTEPRGKFFFLSPSLVKERVYDR